MKDIKKWFLVCNDNPAVEIKGAKNLEDAKQWASNSLGTYNKVEVVEVLYTDVYQISHPIEEDTGRGSGTTTKQMLSAKQGSIYIWPNYNSLLYAKSLALYLNRSDLKIFSRHALDGIVPDISLKTASDIVIDHACTLTVQQERNLQIVERYLNHE